MDRGFFFFFILLSSWNRRKRIFNEFLEEIQTQLFVFDLHFRFLRWDAPWNIDEPREKLPFRSWLWKIYNWKIRITKSIRSITYRRSELALLWSDLIETTRRRRKTTTIDSTLDKLLFYFVFCFRRRIRLQDDDRDELKSYNL